MNESTHLVQKNQHKLFTKNLAWAIAWEYFIDKNITLTFFYQQRIATHLSSYMKFVLIFLN